MPRIPVGSYTLHKTVNGEWLVYDRRSGKLLGQKFTTKDEAIEWIKNRDKHVRRGKVSGQSK
jgi:hypothetical protein